ncbi:hypothetical protein GGTG_04798 [Gaeumannomyces tritici R3-111a-1]|uniref:Peroxidase n=1 Tax=Gaeumannomyces tritici (strain R3-111a-1) TaxID=644352 RepID=J3NU46_GAET3|nr:hypothetical protein GGTG_04798 [Gaeumannomyces tritici R3-111a-1]EJT79714.1 hypothetical protein GGTG_04798 [Gaeumannomyces tritici R3-111a-1]
MGPYHPSHLLASVRSTIPTRLPTLTFARSSLPCCATRNRAFRFPSWQSNLPLSTMRLSITLVLPSLLALAGAVPGPKGGDDSGKSGTRGDDGGRGGGSGKCPEVWGAVKAELNQKFMTGTECNGLARAAIRAIFHDCGSWDQSQGLVGGCDGSLITGVTPDVELDRPENRGLQTVAAYLKDAAARHGTSVADMIVFAGNAATVLCPGGPRVKTFIGRKDSTNSAKPGGLPDVFDTAANLVDLFAKKGYSQAELAALMGAHSTSTQRFVDPSQAGKAQDSTPGQWDVKYYKETIDYAKTGKTPNNVFVFPSDAKLATYQDVGKKFEGFVNNQNKWSSAFGNAMEKMALFGNDKNNMVDCTNALG